MNILILGANGKIARQAEKLFLKETNDNLVYFLRNSKRLANQTSERVTVIEGDATKANQIANAITKYHIDTVYANLAGPMEKFAQEIIKAMEVTELKKLIFIASLGVHDEVPGKFGEWNNRELKDYLPPYKTAVKLITASNLNYVIIRPAWLTDKDEIDYEITNTGEPFKGTEVSRKSVASFVVKASHSSEYDRQDIGLNKPNTDGDKPSFM